MEFRSALKSDKEQIFKLWKNTFGDDFDVIEKYFCGIIEFENVLVCCDNDKVVSMLSLLPANFVLENGEKQKAYCVYAAATDVDYRKQGLMSNLLDYSAQFSSLHEADFIFLHPANEKLYSYYEKNGFQKAFFTSEKEFEEIESSFSYSFVEWNEDILKLNAEFSGNNAFFCGDGYADYIVEGEEVFVETFSSGNVKSLLKNLLEFTKAKRIYVDLPENTLKSNPQGMIRSVNGKAFEDKIYLGITLE